MKTDAREASLLALSQRQRRFEWQLARDEQTRAAGRFVSGKTHDLMNLVQIVQLATLELERCCEATAKEFLDDLTKSAHDAQRSLEEMMAVARPDEVIVPGAPVGAAVDAAISALRPAIAVDIHLATPPDTVTRCTADELEHILIGLALDVVERCAPASTDPGQPGPIEIYVRERVIDGKPWIEIVRSSAFVPAGDRFELRAVEAIAKRAGGELATSDRRGGGEELVVALPVLR
ncbi:MAG: HAMP domain-containing histidine kinase [Deltaproteobacteria bacterium]|nr:HAMP domain-containing histidine kinase [Deltaproteobacteria bacterium]MDQ3298285.1 hypothetical protein [Myxococcota bacterium]